jgi:hypothetical protein
MTTQPGFRTAFGGRQLTWFDLLLAMISLVLLAGAMIAHLLPVPQFVGIAVGAGLTGNLVGYGIYAVTRLQTPTESESTLEARPNRID